MLPQHHQITLPDGSTTTPRGKLEEFAKNDQRPIEKFARDIRPPMLDDDFASTIKAVTMEYGEKICAIVRSLIHKKRVEAEVGASKLNPADKERAREIASKQLNARLGKRLPKEKRDALLSEACGLVGIYYSTSEDVIDEAFQLVVNGANATNKKRKMTTSTSNSFGPLTKETENDAELAENDNHSTTATSVHTPKKAKFLISRERIYKRRFALSRGLELSTVSRDQFIHLRRFLSVDFLREVS